MRLAACIAVAGLVAALAAMGVAAWLLENDTDELERAWKLIGDY